MDLIALLGDLEGGGHARDATADDQSAMSDGQWLTMERPIVDHPVDGHTYQILGLLGGLLRLVHVNPGTLVADIGQIKEIGIQPHLVYRLLEKRLVGARGTRGHNHAIDAVLLYNLLHRFLGILGAGEHVAPGIDDVRQSLGILTDCFHVDGAGDVDTTVANKDTNPWRVARNVDLGRVLLCLGQGIPHSGEERAGLGGCTARLDDRLGNILGAAGRATDIDPRARGRQGMEFISVAEPALSLAKLELLDEFLGTLGGLESHG